MLATLQNNNLPDQDATLLSTNLETSHLETLWVYTSREVISISLLHSFFKGLLITDKCISDYCERLMMRFIYPPSGEHRYYFRLYALDTMLNLKKPARDEVLKAMKGHVIAEVSLLTKYW